MQKKLNGKFTDYETFYELYVRNLIVRNTILFRNNFLIQSINKIDIDIWNKILLYKKILYKKILYKKILLYNVTGKMQLYQLSKNLYYVKLLRE